MPTNKEMREFVKESYKEGFYEGRATGNRHLKDLEQDGCWDESDMKQEMDKLKKVDDLLP